MMYSALSGFADPADESPAAVPTPGHFRAGAALSNITPPLGISINGYFNDRKAVHIHDELHARCLVLDDGSNRVAFAVCDSCMIPREIIDRAKRLVHERTQLRPEHILISATHTHTAPTAVGIFQSEPDKPYTEFLAGRIADGITRAFHNLEPARIGWDMGKDPGDVFNRRWRMKPGTIGPNPFGETNDLVKMNPPVGSPNLVEPAGPTDPEIAILSIQSTKGRPIGLLANYSLHYVGTGRDNEISADYFAAFANQIEQLIGASQQDPPFVAILANGTSGDINNIDFRHPRAAKNPFEQMNAVANAVASEVYRVYGQLKYADWVPIQVKQTELSLRVRQPSAAEIERAKGILASEAGPLKTLEQVYARETVLMSDYAAQVRLFLQAFRIGDLAIAAIPCEVFAETGLAIKQNSPFPTTFTIELANGCNGYLPTPAQHQLGGYETWRARSSYLEIGAEPIIRQTALQLLNELRR